MATCPWSHLRSLDARWEAGDWTPAALGGAWKNDLMEKHGKHVLSFIVVSIIHDSFDFRTHRKAEPSARVGFFPFCALWGGGSALKTMAFDTKEKPLAAWTSQPSRVCYYFLQSKRRKRYVDCVSVSPARACHDYDSPTMTSNYCHPSTT